MLSDEREIERLISGQGSFAVSATPATGMQQATAEPAWIRGMIIALALLFAAIFLLIPLAAVFTEAFREGAHVYLAAISSSEARSAIELTLITAAIAVPLNLVFGVTAAWA